MIKRVESLLCSVRASQHSDTLETLHGVMERSHGCSLVLCVCRAYISAPCVASWRFLLAIYLSRSNAVHPRSSIVKRCPPSTSIILRQSRAKMYQALPLLILSRSSMVTRINVCARRGRAWEHKANALQIWMVCYTTAIFMI